MCTLCNGAARLLRVKQDSLSLFSSTHLAAVIEMRQHSPPASGAVEKWSDRESIGSSGHHASISTVSYILNQRPPQAHPDESEYLSVAVNAFSKT